MFPLLIYINLESWVVMFVPINTSLIYSSILVYYGVYDLDKKDIRVIEKHSDLKKGIFYQREKFKSAKNGMGSNNFDLMCDSVENIKSDIKGLAMNSGMKDEIIKIEGIVKWYRTLESKYTIKTEKSYQVRFPIDIEEKLNQNLTVAYEILMKIQLTLDLI